MLGAISLRGLSDQPCRPVAHHLVAAGPQRRISGDAGISVRPSAVRSDDQFRDGHGRAAALVRPSEQLEPLLESGLYRLTYSAGLLNGEDGRRLRASAADTRRRYQTLVLDQC